MVVVFLSLGTLVVAWRLVHTVLTPLFKQAFDLAGPHHFDAVLVVLIATQTGVIGVFLGLPPPLLQKNSDVAVCSSC